MPDTYGRSRTARYGNFPHLGASGCHLYRRSLVPCSPALALISARAEGVSTLIPLCCMPCMLTMSPVVALLCSLQVLSIKLLHSSLLVLRDRTSVLFTGLRCVFAFTPSDSDFIMCEVLIDVPRAVPASMAAVRSCTRRLREYRRRRLCLQHLTSSATSSLTS